MRLNNFSKLIIKNGKIIKNKTSGLFLPSLETNLNPIAIYDLTDKYNDYKAILMLNDKQFILVEYPSYNVIHNTMYYYDEEKQYYTNGLAKITMNIEGNKLTYTYNEYDTNTLTKTTKLKSSFTSNEHAQICYEIAKCYEYKNPNTIWFANEGYYADYKPAPDYTQPNVYFRDVIVELPQELSKYNNKTNYDVPFYIEISFDEDSTSIYYPSKIENNKIYLPIHKAVDSKFVSGAKYTVKFRINKQKLSGDGINYTDDYEFDFGKYELITFKNINEFK